VVLEARDVRLQYAANAGPDEASWRLDIPELCLRTNTAYSLLGQNMAGKSTLVRILTGTLDPHTVEHASGRLRIDGTVLDLPSPAPVLRKAGIVGVHQNDPMFPDLSIWENVQLGLSEARSRDGRLEHARETVRATLGQLPRTDLDPADPLGALSGGGRALVRILRSVVWGFRVLILDEPTANLDPANAARCFSLLEQSWTGDGAIVLISHSERDHAAFRALALARAQPHGVLRLDRGQLLPSPEP
jgi:ABC-type sugar transport system ATPase subunit